MMNGDLPQIWHVTYMSLPHLNKELARYLFLFKPAFYEVETEIQVMYSVCPLW